MHRILFVGLEYRNFCKRWTRKLCVGSFLCASQLISLKWHLGSLYACLSPWGTGTNNIVVSISFFFCCRPTARPISAFGLDQENVSCKGSDIQQRFLFKLCVFRKPPFSDLILGIQFSAGISSIKGDRENTSLPSKDCVCLWQRL